MSENIVASSGKVSLGASSLGKPSSDYSESENSESADKSVIASAETVQDLEESKDIENLKKLEAAMFLSARFLNIQELILLTDINPLMLKELLEKLTEKYNKEDSAIEIVSRENMWKMDVRQEYVGMVNKLATGTAEFSKAEQETLAVIAYKQPVKQSVIIKIRGNKAYEHIKHFVEIGLVQTKPDGHTQELRLSDDFFEYFHLQKKGEVIVPEQEEDLNNDKEKASSESDDSEEENSENDSEAEEDLKHNLNNKNQDDNI
jgi:segregation and condensation protein B